MSRLHILVEGETEESFVKELIVPHLANLNIFTTTSRVTTSRKIKKGRVYKGGLSSFKKVDREVNLFLKRDNDIYVTTMFDLYALPNDFPSYQTAINKPDGNAKVTDLEDGLANHFNSNRFIPYIQQHEFEALLFSDPDEMENILSILYQIDSNSLVDIRNLFPTPEDINDGPLTAPSKRILDICPSYEKVTDGIYIAEDIGLNKIRQECPHFNDWMQRLESI